MFNKFIVPSLIVSSLTFCLNSFGFSNTHLKCDVRYDIWEICPNETNDLDMSNEELVEKTCDSASKKVSELTNGIYRCKYMGTDEPYACVLRTSRAFEPRTEKFDCRSDYRQQSEEVCMQYTSEFSKPYCAWTIKVTF